MSVPSKRFDHRTVEGLDKYSLDEIAAGLVHEMHQNFRQDALAALAITIVTPFVPMMCQAITLRKELADAVVGVLEQYAVEIQKTVKEKAGDDGEVIPSWIAEDDGDGWEKLIITLRVAPAK